MHNNYHQQKIFLHSHRAKRQFGSRGFGTPANESPSKPS
nr:hypothetical protein I308_00964 [Cryptococcus tetragattii IND107]